MVRLKLNRLNRDQQKTVDALGPARYRKAVGEKKEFIWGFTDAAHWSFRIDLTQSRWKIPGPSMRPATNTKAASS